MPVAARIFHPEARPGRQPLEAWLHAAKARLADRHADAFARAGAEDVRVVPGPAAGESFGACLREVAGDLAGVEGLVVMGSGALALATSADLRRFVDVARQAGQALANNRYSADIIALGGLGALAALPDLRTDNALPRWLEEVAGYRVTDTRASWRLGIDLDSPLDVLLAGQDPASDVQQPPEVDLTALRSGLARLRTVAADPRAELLVAGRTSAAVLAWLERRVASRVRALVEERGLRAGADAAWHERGGTRSARRPPASIVGAVLDRDGPEALGPVLASLADAAVVDTRVLLAHRLGRGETAWPRAEDRFASDLLLPDRIADPWLRALTASAVAAPIPILLGGHTLVGPGLRLALRQERTVRPRSSTMVRAGVGDQGG